MNVMDTNSLLHARERIKLRSRLIAWMKLNDDTGGVVFVEINKELHLLLGFHEDTMNISQYQYQETPEELEKLEALNGPHGYALWKALRAKQGR